MQRPLSPEGTPSQRPLRQVLAVDFGTTYSKIGFRVARDEILDVRSIWVKSSWPNGGESSVPSLISFSPSRNGERQWGFDIAEGSTILSWQKLEFLAGCQSREEELKLIAKALTGMRNLNLQDLQTDETSVPTYPAGDAVDIVANYLEKVREHVVGEMRDDPDFNRFALSEIPLDIVMTVPAEWPDSAINCSYRSMTQAGFDRSNFPTLENIFIVSEPEAAAQYVVKFLQQQQRAHNLRVNDCFILVDAGGGTVDLISYRVTQVEPVFQVAKIGYATNARCGASFIDREFHTFLQRKLRPDEYRRLCDESAADQVGTHTSMSIGMARMTGQFERLKQHFGEPNRPSEEWLEIPYGYNVADNEDESIQDGSIRITE